MKKRSMKQQAAVLTGTNVVVRALGFGMRLVISRVLGSEALGVMELASSAHMLAIAPVTAGLPSAVSRLTATGKGDAPALVLRAGKRLALRLALIIAMLFLVLSPLIARLLGDVRALPALLFSVPCVVILGLSAVYNGYCYGMGNPWPPALSELVEQILRFGITVGIVLMLPGLTTAYRAGAPAFATMIAEGAGLLLVVLLLRGIASPPRDTVREKILQKRLFRLSLPLTGMRLVSTGLRSVNGVLIPQRLIASGLNQAEAISRLGMLNGMVMPLMVLPAMLTSALSMVGTPAIAKREGSPKQARALALQLLAPAALAGALCAVALYLGAPLIAGKLYRLPELMPLVRTLCPMAFLFSLQHVMGGLLTGLGLQRKALKATVIGAVVSLACTFWWTALPGMRLYGAGYASMLGNLVVLLEDVALFIRHTSGRKSATNIE